MSAPLLAFNQARKVFRTEGRPEMVAVERADVRIDPGEFVCLLGPSGCGKSTLLNMAAGFEFPSAGGVAFADRQVEGPGSERAVVFQQAALFPWLSVKDNLTFGTQLSGGRRKDALESARHFLERVGLSGFEDHYPAELSGGMQQRVQIARALMMQSRLLLMDEPFGALDAQTRALMQQLLLDLWEEYRQAVLFITHDVDESILLADTVYVMTARPGRIKERIDITLPRPRGQETSMSAEFNDYRRRITELIREESVLASGVTASKESTS